MAALVELPSPLQGEKEKVPSKLELIQAQKA